MMEDRQPVEEVPALVKRDQIREHRGSLGVVAETHRSSGVRKVRMAVNAKQSINEKIREWYVTRKVIGIAGTP
jgi:hypothetical protein